MRVPRSQWPSDWGEILLGDLCDIQIGKTPRRSQHEYFGGTNVWLTISDMTSRVVADSSEKITDKAIVDGQARLVKAGTLLMSFKLTIGKLAFAGIDLYTNEAIAALNIVQEHKQTVLKDFLYWALQAVPISGEADLAVKGLTLNKQKLSRIALPLPYPDDPARSLAEQRRIVARIEALLAEVGECRALQQEILADTDILMQSFLEEVFSELESVSSSLAPLGFHFEVTMGQSPPGSSYSDDPNDGPPLLNGPSEFGPSSPTPVQWTTAPTRICHPGDLLICVRGATTGRMNWADQSYCIGRGLASIRSRNSKLSNIEYAARFLGYKSSQILAAGRGSTFPNLSKAQLEGMKIPIIEIARQEWVAGYLDEIQQEIVEMRKLEEENQLFLAELEQGILAKAFEGNL